jgi:hypothetical protein
MYHALRFRKRKQTGVWRAAAGEASPCPFVNRGSAPLKDAKKRSCYFSLIQPVVTPIYLSLKHSFSRGHLNRTAFRALQKPLLLQWLEHVTAICSPADGRLETAF